MANTQPLEIIAAPFDILRAAVGTAFPTIQTNPSAAWSKIGSNGALNYDDGEGVTVVHEQEFAEFRALGDAGVRKMFRTKEALRVKVKVYDLTLEQYKAALNDNPVTATAAASGVAGQKKLGLSRGFTVATMALLIRGNVSPYGTAAAWNAQYEIPIAVQIGSPEVIYKKSEPVGLALEWMSLVDPSAASVDERFGRLVMQTADALP